MIRILKPLNWHVHCLFLIFDQHSKNCTELNFRLTLPPRMSRKPSAFFFTIQTLAPFYFTCFKWVLFWSKKRRQWEVTLSVFQILLLTTISKIYLKWRTVLLLSMTNYGGGHWVLRFCKFSHFEDELFSYLLGCVIVLLQELVFRFPTNNKKVFQIWYSMQFSVLNRKTPIIENDSNI